MVLILILQLYGINILFLKLYGIDINFTIIWY